VIAGKSVPASDSVSDPFKAFAVANKSIRGRDAKEKPDLIRSLNAATKDYE
jgi:hypothetical protein